MSFLDDLKQKVGALGAAVPGVEGQLKHVLDLVNDPAHGGLTGLVQRFQSQGLGATIQSWIGTGTNQPITPAALQKVLGDQRIQALATKMGISPETVAHQLSAVLPTVIDHLTPTGQLPGVPGGAGGAVKR
jgi:uncharacterized protein YidB (DUF937 family)